MNNNGKKHPTWQWVACLAVSVLIAIGGYAYANHEQRLQEIQKTKAEKIDLQRLEGKIDDKADKEDIRLLDGKLQEIINFHIKK